MMCPHVVWDEPTRLADSSLEIAPCFNQATTGAEVHPRILAAAPNAPVVVKQFADRFVKTTLGKTRT